MARSNSRLVIHVAGKYEGYGLDIQDLVQESVYALLRKVGKARMECIMEGEQPTNTNAARRAGITIEKLAKLRAKTRKNRSMQDQVWSDEGVTPSRYFHFISCHLFDERIACSNWTSESMSPW
ncbi:hypothetical protein ABZP36_001452 [Zizania latifolia]